MKTITAPRDFKKTYWAMSHDCVYRFDTEAERDAFLDKHDGEPLLSTGALIRKIRRLGIKAFPVRVEES